jgi:hypothetical protein
MKGKPRLDNGKPRSERIKHIRNKTLAFHSNEKKQSVSRTNQLMLDKLIDISKRKYSASTPRQLMYGPVSLNAKNRKDETRRIATENE